MSAEEDAKNGTTDGNDEVADDEKIQFKNASDEDLVIESDSEDENEAIVNLAKQNLSEIPEMTAKSKGPNATTLILTNNKLQSLKYLDSFSNVTTLQLDRNGLKSIKDFPTLSYLKTLWLNNNELNNLNQLVTILKKQCPKLEYLSLLGNPLCPDVYFEDSNESRYTRFRHTIITNLPSLTFLDTTQITPEERAEAQKRAKFLKIAKPDENQMEDVADENETEEEDTHETGAYKQVEPAAFLGKGRIKYDGRESEGNRFILNNDL